MKTRSGKGYVKPSVSAKAKKPTKNTAASRKRVKAAAGKSRVVDLTHPNGSDSVQTKSGNKKSIKQAGIGKKVLKLTKPMKEAVKQVFAPNQIRGVYKNYNYGYMVSKYANTDNTQYVYPVTVTNTDSITSGLFMPSDFLHAASVMWNAKADNQARAYGDTNNFDKQSFKCNVINSYCQHTIRNNTQGDLTYTVWTCAPKDNGTSADIPDYVWQKAYTTAIAATQINSGVGNTTFGESPNKFAVFRDMFKSSFTKFTLTPGQTRVWVTQGPKNMELETFKQLENDALWLPVAKYTRFVFVVVQSELTITSGMTTGRYTDLDGSAGYATPIENVLYYKLSMPENAGFRFTQAGTPTSAGDRQILTQRLDKYHVYNYGAAQGAFNIVKVEEKDPTTIETASKQ